MGTLNSVLLYIQCQTTETRMQIKQKQKQNKKNKNKKNVWKCTGMPKSNIQLPAPETNSNNAHLPTKRRGFPLHSNWMSL